MADDAFNDEDDGRDLQFESRTALDSALAGEFLKRVLDEGDCVRFTLVRHQGLGPARESLRPLKISGRLVWQREECNGKQVMVRNYAPGPEAEAALRELLETTGAREYHLTAVQGDLHVRITRKGRSLISRGRPREEAVAGPAQHDHEKDQPLNRFDSAALLKVLGLADGTGAIRASMRGKTDQINAFLRELDALLDEEKPDPSRRFCIVDCGCGRAYLTLAASLYLQQVRGLDICVRGVDRNAGIIAKTSAMAESLGLAGSVEFVAEDLAAYKPDVQPDLVLSLHACDVATDLAIACGVRSGARYMLVAPCCQHDLQKQIKDSGPMRALLRHGILRERLADLMTDAFRAQILRILGYRVRISEFVSSEATARNIMLRAVFGVRKHMASIEDEYAEMRDFWHVTPVLETLLADKLQPAEKH